jgi:predicted amidophosphoribosyltransferase
MNAGSGRSPDRLVWPPKPVDAQDSIRWKIPGSSRDPDRTFVDIPAELVGLDPAPQPTPSAGWLDQVERYWLGLTSQGFIERARKYGWAPDSTGAYCPRCGSRVGLYELAIPEAGDAGTSGCPACERKRLPWTRCVRLGDYHGLLRRAVHELKFRRWRPVGTEIGSMLGAALAGELDRAGVARAECCIVPISSSFWRRVWRGIDHTQVLARSASRVCGVPVVHALGRKLRPSQLAVSASERRRNVKGSFVCRLGIPEGIRVAIVLDDVRTTGATMLEACGTLRQGWKRPGGELEIWSAVAGVASSRRRPLAWAEDGAV